MSCYYSALRDMLVLKCDGCGRTVDLGKGETDRCLCHAYIHENGWKTMRRRGKWLNICDECLAELLSINRKKFLEEMVGGPHEKEK